MSNPGAYLVKYVSNKDLFKRTLSSVVLSKALLTTTARRRLASHSHEYRSAALEASLAEDPNIYFVSTLLHKQAKQTNIL
jgi:hypothetical protein